MVQNLTVPALNELDPEELLDDVLQDDQTLRLVEDAIRRGRARYFRVSRTEDAPTLDPNASTNRVVEELAWAGFTPNWLLSYHYEGEEANLVRFHYDPHAHSELPFRQLHVRLFADGTIDAHEEPSALMHKGPHLREASFDRDLGTREVKRILEDAGLDIERLEEAR
jgi:hypothetical protein